MSGRQDLRIRNEETGFAKNYTRACGVFIEQVASSAVVAHFRGFDGPAYEASASLRGQVASGRGTEAFCGASRLAQNAVFVFAFILAEHIKKVGRGPFTGTYSRNPQGSLTYGK